MMMFQLPCFTRGDKLPYQMCLGKWPDVDAKSKPTAQHAVPDLQQITMPMIHPNTD